MGCELVFIAGSDESGTESTLILIRHGESLWNEKNLFTGCCDVPLTKRGVEEAIEAGKRISCIPIDVIFTSALIRAQMTAMLAMTQHRRKKVVLVQAIGIMNNAYKKGLCLFKLTFFFTEHIPML